MARVRRPKVTGVLDQLEDATVPAQEHITVNDTVSFGTGSIYQVMGITADKKAVLIIQGDRVEVPLDRLQKANSCLIRARAKPPIRRR